MKGNSDKSHLLLIMSTSSTASINGDIMKNSESEKLLGVMIDFKLIGFSVAGKLIIV